MADAGSSLAGSDRTVVRDDHVVGLYALRNTILYGRYESRHGEQRWARDRRWMRVVAGRRRRVHGLPTGAAPFSIGLDRDGRVVVVLGRPDRRATRVSRWWLYDVVRDTARRLRIPARTGCVIRSVAVWRARLAYEQQCSDVSSVVLTDERRAQRLMRVQGNVARIMLRDRSLAVIDAYGGDASGMMWRVLDRGRRCPLSVAVVEDELGIWAGLDSHGLTWVTAHYEFDGMTFSGLEARHIELSGRCEAGPTVRRTGEGLLPPTPINANGPGFNAAPNAGVAIDGLTVYYSTDAGIHRVRLPA
jgi:hypothetical protein